MIDPIGERRGDTRRIMQLESECNTRAQEKSLPDTNDAFGAGKQASRLHEIVVINSVAVFGDLAFDFRGVNPGDEVFHIPDNMKRRVRHNLRPNPDVALLNERNRLPHRFAELVLHKNNWKPAPSKTGCRNLLTLSQAFFCRNEAHAKALF